MHHHTELSFVDEFRWVSPLHYLEKRMTERSSSLVHVASGSAIFTLLLRRRVAFLYRTATCRPLFKPSASLLSTYRQSICVSNFCRTFKVFIWLSLIYNVNPLTPNDNYRGRTAPLTSKCCILYIYSTNIGTEYFKHGIYSTFYSSKCSLFHNSNVFVACIIHILYTGCAKVLKINSGAKSLRQ